MLSPLFETFLTFFLRPIEIIRTYDMRYLQPDLIAGLTVAVITLPQAMAYALIAELPPEVGLYSAIVGAIVGGLWGSSNHLQTGPTNTTSLLILSILLGIAVPGTEAYIIAAGMMAILVGVFRLLMGLARLGVLVNFVSDSVIVGFTSGAGILIFINQIRNLLRLDIPSAPTLWQTIPNLVTNIATTHWPSLLIGAVTIALILVLKRVNRKLPGPLIGMVVGAALVALLQLDIGGVKVVGELPRGLPPLAKLPLSDTALIGRLAVGAGDSGRHRAGGSNVHRAQHRQPHRRTVGQQPGIYWARTCQSGMRFLVRLHQFRIVHPLGGRLRSRRKNIPLQRL